MRSLMLAVLAGLIGLLAGAAARILYLLIAVAGNLVFHQRLSATLSSPVGHGLGWAIVVVPALGGLAVGAMARWGSPKIRGHGIPEAMEAVLFNDSRISARVAVLKPLSAALAIGTGGPFGAEGPIIQTGGALGSLAGQAAHVTPAERKVLLACGAAAGMAATFGTPVAAVVFAIEMLLFEFKARSLVPLVIAASVAATVHQSLLGPGPLFQVAATDFWSPQALPFYALLGLACGVLAALFGKALYAVEDAFERLPFHWMWWPAIGGLGVGLIGRFHPEVLGVGYDLISDVLNARLALSALLAVVVFKSGALLVSLGSGTSGGLLAPMFLVGAAFGGAFAMVLDAAFPGLNLSPAAFALVGMAAIFGAASRATLALILFAFEITQNYQAILPLMVVGAIASAVARSLMPNSIMTEKLARRGLSIAQDYEVDVFHHLAVEQVMSRHPVTVDAGETLAVVGERIRKNGHALLHQGIVVTEGGMVTGLITRRDIGRLLAEGADPATPVGKVATCPAITAHADEPLLAAVGRMLDHDIGRIVVVARDDPRRLVGYLGRTALLQARRHHRRQECEIERGWFPAFKGRWGRDGTRLN